MKAKRKYKRIEIVWARTVSRRFHKDTVFISHRDGWVTWARLDRSRVLVSTCQEERFDEAGEEESIQLWPSEIAELASRFCPKQAGTPNQRRQ